VTVALSDATVALQTETRNISASGFYCTLERFIPPMTKLQLEMELPSNARRHRIRCTGVVVRTEPTVANPEHGAFNVAVFFTDLAERDRASIAQFVRDRLSNASTSSD